VLTKVAVAGAFGTAIRLVGLLPLAVAVYANPLTLLLLNTFGCGVAGVVVAKGADTPVRSVLTHGFLGAFTTFSGVIIAAGRIGHSLGLVAEDSSRMTGLGLVLALGYIAVSFVAGFVVFVSARRLASR
jgi:fluoride ion exporter CrcB/FEX